MLAFLNLAAQAGAALPLIAALTLISGRRGNAAFALYGGKSLLALALPLAFCAPLAIAGSYMAEVGHFDTGWAQKLAPLLAPAGMPWTTSCMASLLGVVLVAFAWLASASAGIRLQVEKYRLKRIALPLALCLGAAFCFFAATMLQHWPFSGLAEGLGWDRASMAIFRHASRNFFQGFCPAGACALIALNFHALAPRYLTIAARWLAFWAVAGCLPAVLTTWGAVTGMGLAQPAALAQGFRPQTLALVFLTLALICWAVILWRPRMWKALAASGLLLLLLQRAAPLILA